MPVPLPLMRSQCFEASDIFDFFMLRLFHTVRFFQRSRLIEGRCSAIPNRCWDAFVYLPHRRRLHRGAA